ncbi:hypothetical protein Afil01_30710 [Actinorhabdospora filicis]|uniref:Glutamate/phenylalanine/leucine/valine/L-tryptophan dehydrogenase C-terminal domain-containing protein n=1 Tax=Actinorhabdospora filicis TaxID=1785913 RepID=A0A9W6SM22_9ACTN|nr:Glu/Leu/Phe/Val dehydrogenase dimerization domain-containing protein [Actinorhabdospora filicis]GLZ78264.1 hypothetical protein Afil01_30710 [Actinorhabdospora filicis]
MSQIITYTDPLEGFPGWLVYDETTCRIAAGGFRVQPGLTEGTLRALAAKMTLKQRLLGINVDGAKCGIAYDPRSRGKPEAIRRFLSFLRQELLHRMSMGCDMGTHWDELETLARAEGIPGIKSAIRAAQGLDEDAFAARMAVLRGPLGGMDLAQRRAGHVLAMIALAAAERAGLGTGLTIGLQGFGNLGRAAACSLLESAATITAVADEYGCAADPAGLDVADMLASSYQTPVPAMGHRRALPSAGLLGLPCDLLVLAAGSEAIGEDQVAAVQAPVVVVGANCGLSSTVEKLLFERGILVIPDFVGGIGGSASMEALFGPRQTPSPREVLDTLGGMSRALVTDLVDGARRNSTSVRDQALERVDTRTVLGDERPYGDSPYLQAALAERPGRRTRS